MITSGSNSVICREKNARICGFRVRVRTSTPCKRQTHGRRIGCVGLDTARLQFPQKFLVIGIAEVLDTSDNSDFVTAFGERLHQQPVRFIAASVRREIERVVRQEDTHRAISSYDREGVSTKEPAGMAKGWRSSRAAATPERVQGETSNARNLLPAISKRSQLQLPWICLLRFRKFVDR